MKLHKHKLQLQQQQQQQVAAAVAAAQTQQAAGAQPATQVQAAQAAQGNPQMAAVAAPRPGAVLTGTTVANLQVARLVSSNSSTPSFAFTVGLWFYICPSHVVFIMLFTFVLF